MVRDPHSNPTALLDPVTASACRPFLTLCWCADASVPPRLRSFPPSCVPPRLGAAHCCSRWWADASYRAPDLRGSKRCWSNAAHIAAAAAACAASERRAPAGCRPVASCSAAVASGAGRGSAAQQRGRRQGRGDTAGRELPRHRDCAALAGGRGRGSRRLHRRHRWVQRDLNPKPSRRLRKRHRWTQRDL